MCQTTANRPNSKKQPNITNRSPTQLQYPYDIYQFVCPVVGIDWNTGRVFFTATVKIRL